MRHFSYFLFENFDPDEEAQNPLNPRRFLGVKTDAVLSYLADAPVGTCSYAQCAQLFGESTLRSLISGGILRRQGKALLFDTPIFLREDAVPLQRGITNAAQPLTDRLEALLPELRSICGNIENGFSVEMNLYHVLCGMVFDGSFFDYLDRHGAVATSRSHSSGLDYLSVIYEKCPELEAYSDGLLCSYNRLADQRCALQSFGDANGSRLDFYRFFRLLENGELPSRFQGALLLLKDACSADKHILLDQVVHLITDGSCDPAVMALLEYFEYAKDGKLCVPVYTDADAGFISQIAKAVESHLGPAFISALETVSGQLQITATGHGAAPAEIANELYHLLFGSVNEELVSRGIVTKPPFVCGEGRYLRCVQAISSL